MVSTRGVRSSTRGGTSARGGSNSSTNTANVPSTSTASGSTSTANATTASTTPASAPPAASAGHTTAEPISDAEVIAAAKHVRSTMKSDADKDLDLYMVKVTNGETVEIDNNTDEEVAFRALAEADTIDETVAPENITSLVIRTLYVGAAGISLTRIPTSTDDVVRNMARLHRTGKIFHQSFRQGMSNGYSAQELRYWDMHMSKEHLAAFKSALWDPAINWTFNELEGDNGPMYFTLAQGSDRAIPDAVKLRVPKIISVLSPQLGALAIAAITARHYVPTPPITCTKNDAIIAAYGLAITGLIGMQCIESNGTEVWYPDGDWILVDERPEPREFREMGLIIKSHLSQARDAATLALVTKIQWWNTNHHTGTRSSLNSGIVHKAMDLLPDAKMYKIDDVHMIGHWASTLVVMKMLKKDVKKCRAVTVPLQNTIIMPEIYIRAHQLPAGCHKMAWCGSAFEVLINSSIVEKLPKAVMGIVAETLLKVKEIRAEDVNYHVGALYLTGKERKSYDDNLAPGGLAIPYIYFALPNSTLAQAPYFKNNKDGGYRALPGFNDSVHSIFEAYMDSAVSRDFRAYVGKRAAADNISTMESGGGPVNAKLLRSMKSVDVADGKAIVDELCEKPSLNKHVPVVEEPEEEPEDFDNLIDLP